MSLEPARILTEFPIAYKYELYYNVSDQTKDLLCAAFSRLLVSRTATTATATTTKSNHIKNNNSHISLATLWHDTAVNKAISSDLNKASHTHTHAHRQIYVCTGILWHIRLNITHNKRHKLVIREMTWIACSFCCCSCLLPNAKQKAPTNFMRPAALVSKLAQHNGQNSTTKAAQKIQIYIDF